MGNVATKSKMTASEKRGVEKVIRERFKALRRGLDMKSFAITEQIRVALEKAVEDDRDDIIEKVADIRRRAMALEVEGAEIADEAYKIGIVFDSPRNRNYDLKKMNPVSLIIRDEVFNAHADRMAKAKSKEIVTTVNQKLHTAAIDIMETQLLEDLWIEDLESEKAREFLTKIPTIGQLIEQVASEDPLKMLKA